MEKASPQKGMEKVWKKVWKSHVQPPMGKGMEKGMEKHAKQYCEQLYKRSDKAPELPRASCVIKCRQASKQTPPGPTCNSKQA